MLSPKYTALFAKFNFTLTHPPNHLHKNLDDNSSVISINDIEVQNDMKEYNYIKEMLATNPIPIPQTQIQTQSTQNSDTSQPLTHQEVLTPQTYCKQNNIQSKYIQYIKQQNIKSNPQDYDYDIPDLSQENDDSQSMDIDWEMIKKHQHNSGNRPKKTLHTKYIEIPFAVSRLIFQLRTRCLPLAPQLVNYKYLPLEYKTKCPCCQEKTKETMEHFLFHCKALDANIQNHLPFNLNINNLYYLLSDTVLMQ